ncbi:MAG: acyl-CoA thioesterase [Alphaproteobacteria bacterium]|jgi:acyl-CoA thioesterase YciA|nr:acyl-CoA thioesterase [Alphaproteobacteria bacterium]
MTDRKEQSNRPPEIEPAIRAIAMPADANGNGDIFGGWIMSQMDLAGGSVASVQARGRVATVGVKEIAFHVPVAIGDEVSCYAELTRRGNTSVTTNIEVWARRRNFDIQVKVTEGEFTYVAINDDGTPKSLPPMEDAK